MPRYIFKCECNHTREKTLSFAEFDKLGPERALGCIDCSAEFDHLENFVHDEVVLMPVVVQPVTFVIL